MKRVLLLIPLLPAVVFAAAVTPSVDMYSNQTIGGTKTFTGTVIVPTRTKGDNSTKAASTSYVDTGLSGKVGTAVFSGYTSARRATVDYVNSVAFNNPVFTAYTSAQRKQTVTKDLIVSGPWVDSRAYNTLADADAAAVSSSRVLVISTPYTTVPATLSAAVKMLPGGKLDGTGSVNITGTFDGAPNCFGASQTVTGLALVRPEWFGAITGNTSNDSAKLNRAVAAVADKGTLLFGAGVYSGSLSVRRNNISVVGEGSSVTTIKIPAGVDSNVLEIGDTASGNDAVEYTNIRVSGLTLDGNKTASVAPTGDLTGWGMPVTKTSYSRFEDIRAVNCWNGGVGFFINSNYNTVNGVYTSGNAGTFGEPGFDVNSSKNNSFTGIISKGDKYGVRLLDNCWGNYVQAVIQNPVVGGFIYHNQLVNESHGNEIHVTVDGGVTSDAVQIGANCRKSVIVATVSNSGGGGLHLIQQDNPVNNPSGNTIILNTSNTQREALLVGGDYNSVHIVSNTDGLAGGQGDYHAIDVTGNGNTITGKVVDSSPWNVRTFILRAESSHNQLSVVRNDEYNLVYDLGTDNHIERPTGYGGDIASDAEILVPYKGSVFRVTGSNGITAITADLKGRVITLVFSAPCIVTDGSNLKLAGDISALAGTTLQLYSDGTNWIEISRSIN